MKNFFVHFLYRDPAFEAFDDFSDFVESISCETSKSCQVRGSNPCRGAITNKTSGLQKLLALLYKHLYGKAMPSVQAVVRAALELALHRV